MSTEFEVGGRVCIKGRGVDSLLHAHDEIVRITKTLVVVKSGRRFRVADEGSVPYSAYGGSSISVKCQAPSEMRGGRSG